MAGVVDYVVKSLNAICYRNTRRRWRGGLNHLYGCGVAINAPAAVVPIRTIHNISLNPNFGGEVMVIGLGCEKLQPERLLTGTDDVQAIPVESASIVSLQDEKHVGFQSMVEDICRSPNAIYKTESTSAEKPVRLQNWLSACSAVAAMRFLA